MKYCLLILLFTISNSFSQDIIYKKEGGKIQSIIKDANDESIKYALFQNADGPTPTIARSDIEKIIFENGAVEDFRNAPPPSSLTVEEAKKIILDKINNYAFDAKSSLRVYRAVFEGDYLKLWTMRSRGDEPYTDPVLFDFSRAYDFQDISYRGNESYINIFVGFITEKQKLDKVKLVMRVLQPEEAKAIVNILKIYNRLLAEKDIGTEG